jgi:erythromycin esterase
MKKAGFIYFLCSLFFNSYGQSIDQGQYNWVMEKAVKLTDITDTPEFRKLLQPVIDELKNHTVIGLGEGTHGTGEFTVLRALITRMLAEQNTINTICIENPFGSTWYLDSLLNSATVDLNGLMKETLLSIYQTTEFKQFLEWVRSYNAKSDHKLRLVGIDFSEIKHTAMLLQQKLAAFGINDLSQVADSIYTCAAFQDSTWINMNNRRFKFNPKATVLNSVALYKHVKKLEDLLTRYNIPQTELIKSCLLNFRHATDVFVKPAQGKAPASRDQLMAEMVNLTNADNKKGIVVWAHNVHIGYEPTFEGGNGGGMGRIIKDQHPDYFALGTCTASGTYSATKERFDTKQNLMSAYKLPTPDKQSWENLFATSNAGAFYLDLRLNKQFQEVNLKHRIIGYRVISKSLSSSYTSKNIGNLYDAIFFIKNTNASNHLIQ